MTSIGNKHIIAENILRYLNKSKKTQKEFCRDLGFKEATVSDWLNAKIYPRIDKIEKMANYFGCNKSDLIEKQEDVVKKNGIDIKYLLKNGTVWYDGLEYPLTKEKGEMLARMVKAALDDK